MKKVIKYAPIITLTWVLIFWLGLHLASNGQGDVDNWAFVSSETSTGWNDLLAQIGHSSTLHWLCNSVFMVIFGWPCEALLGKMRYIFVTLATVVVYFTVEELFLHSYGIGASGWLSAMPGVTLAATVWHGRRHMNDDLSVIQGTGTLYMLSVMSTLIDIDMVGVDNGINHLAHIAGAIIGLLVFIASLPFTIRPVKKAYAEWRREAAYQRDSNRRRAQWQLQDIREGRWNAHPKTVKRLEKLAA